MEYINFDVPPYPYFLIAGEAFYRRGDSHGRRKNIGCFDLIFVEYGELYLTDGNISYHLKQNEILLIKPDQCHYGHKAIEMDTKFNWLHFKSAGDFHYTSDHVILNEKYTPSSTYSVEKSTLVLPVRKELSVIERNELLVLFGKLKSRVIDKYRQANIKNKMSLSFVERQYNFLKILNIIQMQNFMNASESKVLAFNVMDFILQNYMFQITLTDISNFFNYSSEHIIRSFKKEFNMTPNRALTETRLNNAKKLLMSSNLSIKEISTESGFSSCSYFVKVFKSILQQTPKQYRNMTKN